MQRALSQKLLGKKPHRELLAFLDEWVRAIAPVWQRTGCRATRPR